MYTNHVPNMLIWNFLIHIRRTSKFIHSIFLTPFVPLNSLTAEYCIKSQFYLCIAFEIVFSILLYLMMMYWMFLWSVPVRIWQVQPHLQYLHFNIYVFLSTYTLGCLSLFYLRVRETENLLSSVSPLRCLADRSSILVSHVSCREGNTWVATVASRGVH